MSKSIFGIRNMTINHGLHEATTIELELVAHPGYNGEEIYTAEWDMMFPGPVIVKCQHCGQWGARKTACRYCGAPVD